MTRRFLSGTLLLALVLLATACATNGEPDTGTTPGDLEGPALVLFYTDN